MRDLGTHPAPDSAHPWAGRTSHGGSTESTLDDRGHDHGEHHDHGSGFLQRLRHALTPHGHGVTDKLDNALESSRLGIRAVKVSLVVLFATCVAQVFVVVASGSVALLSDTVHNLTDALTALPLWFAFVLGRRPRTARYTHGYGRAEDLAGVFIVLVVATSTLIALYESVNRLLHPQPVRHLGMIALAGAFGFVGNEVVAVYRIRVGRRIGSAALVADGLHARTDGLTSLAVVVGACGVAAGWQHADAVVGLLIGLMILFVLTGATRQMYHRLMDAVEPSLVGQVGAVARGTEGVVDVDDIRLRWVGHSLHADMRIVVDASASLVAAHAIADRVHHQLLHEIDHLREVHVHVDPKEHDGIDHHVETAHHSR